MELKKDTLVAIVGGGWKKLCPLGIIENFANDQFEVKIFGKAGGKTGQDVIYVEKKEFLIPIQEDCTIHPGKKLPLDFMKAIQDLAIKCHNFEAEASKSHNEKLAKDELPHIAR